MAVIHVVEDDASVRELIRVTLQSGGFDVRAFASGEDFLASHNNEADLILLDIMLPGIDGLAVLKRLQNMGCEIPVILLTARNTEIDKVTGLDMGASDYIAKPFGVLELIARVKAALRRTHKPSDEIQAGIVSLNLSKRKAYVNGLAATLTYKEFEMLHLFMRNEGIVLTRDRFLDKIWGVETGIETRTVDVHIKTLRAKLGAAGKYIKTVRNVGYVFSPAEVE
ncbi:MAG TPA: DNA-binding response regulator [Clostridiales bacterium]|nr:DNA-binding response regulator [Clostridiales bacterium]